MRLAVSHGLLPETFVQPLSAIHTYGILPGILSASTFSSTGSLKRCAGDLSSYDSVACCR